MSRRQDREGVHRMEVQYRRNMTQAAAQRVAGQDERGWNHPCTVWDRWTEFNYACAVLWRFTILRAHESAFARENDLRHVRMSLAKAHAAPKARLP